MDKSRLENSDCSNDFYPDWVMEELSKQTKWFEQVRVAIPEGQQRNLRIKGSVEVISELSLLLSALGMGQGVLQGGGEGDSPEQMITAGVFATRMLSNDNEPQMCELIVLGDLISVEQDRGGLFLNLKEKYLGVDNQRREIYFDVDDMCPESGNSLGNMVRVGWKNC